MADDKFFQTDIQGFDKQINDYLAHINDSSGLMKIIATDAKNQVQRRFRTATDGDGKPWEKLADSTIKQRRKGSSKPLNNTGEGKNSWTTFYDKNQAGAGTPLKKLEIHDDGGTFKRKAHKKTMHFKHRKSDDSIRMTSKRKSNFDMNVNVKEHKFTMPRRNMTKMSTKQIERYTKWVAQFMAGKKF